MHKAPRRGRVRSVTPSPARARERAPRVPARASRVGSTACCDCGEAANNSSAVRSTASSAKTTAAGTRGERAKRDATAAGFL